MCDDRNERSNICISTPDGLYHLFLVFLTTITNNDRNIPRELTNLMVCKHMVFSSSTCSVLSYLHLQSHTWKCLWGRQRTAKKICIEQRVLSRKADDVAMEFDHESFSTRNNYKSKLISVNLRTSKCHKISNKINRGCSTVFDFCASRIKLWSS